MLFIVSFRLVKVALVISCTFRSWLIVMPVDDCLISDATSVSFKEAPVYIGIDPCVVDPIELILYK